MPPMSRKKSMIELDDSQMKFLKEIYEQPAGIWRPEGDKYRLACLLVNLGFIEWVGNKLYTTIEGCRIVQEKCNMPQQFASIAENYLTQKEISKIAAAIRETTSDAILDLIKGKSDEDLVALAFKQDAVKEAVKEAMVIHFPRNQKFYQDT